MFLFDIVTPLTVAEAKTDYEKRRQRERDVDAGKPVARQPKNPQTDYAKKRAQEKKELKLGEETVVDPVNDNFTPDDLKSLERIRDLPTLKARAKELIKGKPVKRMKPEKIAFFYDRVDQLNSPMAIIKMLYDMLLAGEGHKVIGSKSSMNPNSYRARFGETSNVQEARLQVGDPVVVTAPNEFEGKTGEISELSPSGKFVIVNLYNHGKHSMHLSDVEYNQYADEEDDELAEDAGPSPVAGAITRRILSQHLDLLKQYGPELVGAAVDNVADYVGDVEEIGSSDVSAWVNQVERMLRDNPPEAFREGWFFKSPEEKEKADKQLNTKMRENIDVAISQLIPALIEKITYNQFEGTGTDWVGIRSRVFSGLRILDNSIKPELKKVSDSITAKLKAFGTNPALDASKADLFSLNPFKDSTKEYRLKFNQQMMMDKDYILKLLNQYLLLLNKSVEQSVAEGWSDAIVAQRTGQPRTPYSVYIKGKKWKDFENDDHAENVANKLRAKFKADGRDASVITIAPTDYDKGIAEAGSPAQQAAIAIAMKKAGKKPKQVDELSVDTLKSYADKRDAQVAAMKADNPKPAPGSKEWVQQAVPAQQVNLAKRKIARKERQTGVVEDAGSWIVYDPETKQIKKRFKTHTAGKSYAKTHGLGFASSEYYFDNIKEPAVAEAQTDYAKRRAEQRRQEQLGENYWTRLQNERSTKLNSLINELKESVKQ